ncbi:uncharacterized protein TNCV_3571591 [Trichonephila clavipes]|nr:uncharacterized protein TNCV_3571591 [Trichonephila clavipes]
MRFLMISLSYGATKDPPWKRTRDFVTCMIVRVGRYLSHCNYKAFENSWYPCKQDTISNKNPPKIKVDRLKFELEIGEALASSPSTNKGNLTDALAKGSRCYNPLAIHDMPFNLSIPG